VLAITLEDLRETKEDEIREMKKYGIRTWRKPKITREEDEKYQIQDYQISIFPDSITIPPKKWTRVLSKSVPSNRSTIEVAFQVVTVTAFRQIWHRRKTAIGNWNGISAAVNEKTVRDPKDEYCVKNMKGRKNSSDWGNDSNLLAKQGKTRTPQIEKDLRIFPSQNSIILNK
jgi:hypothetical protein